MKKEPNVALHLHVPSHDESEVSAMSVPVPSEPWITEELLLNTQRIWSEVAGRIISADEAVEMLRNVKGLADVLWDIMQERVQS